MEATGNETRVQALEIESPRLTGALSGRITGPFSLAGFTRAPAATLDLSGHLEVPDISWLATRFPVLRRLGGSANTTFFLHGTPDRPEFAAEIALRNGELRSRTRLPSIEELAVDASLAGNDLLLKKINGFLGGAPINGSGTVSRLADDTIALDLDLAGEDLLFYRTGGEKIRGNARLHLSGITEALSIQGQIMVTDARFSRNIDTFSYISSALTEATAPTTARIPLSLEDGYFRNARLEVMIQARDSIVLANNLIRGRASADLLLGGTAEVPVLSGEIRLNSTQVTLPAGRMTVDSGLIRFQESEPNRARLDINASATMAGYDITALVEGFSDQPAITLSSVPTLANEDLVLLLLAGRRPVSGSNGSGRTASSVAVFLGRSVLEKLFGPTLEESDESIYDRFELDIGQEITQQGDETVNIRFRLADDLIRPETSLFLTAEKDVWDDYNGGLRLVFHFK